MPPQATGSADGQAPARDRAVYTLLALAVLALAVVPIGTAVFWLGFVRGDSPCVMCWEQRIGMALIALIGLFVLRYGPKGRYVGLALVVGAYGVFMGLRHVGMHAARDVGQGFSLEILGAHTYTWSLFIFWVAIVAMSVLLMAARERALPEPRALRPLERLAMLVFLVVIAGRSRSTRRPRSRCAAAGRSTSRMPRRSRPTRAPVRWRICRCCRSSCRRRSASSCGARRPIWHTTPPRTGSC
jgi:disulfide bond formation protein DsbB